MKTTDKEFASLPFKVDGKIDYLKEYPSLRNHKEFLSDTGFAFDDIFKYVVLFYSQHTPLLSVTDVNERRVTAAKLAGLDVTDPKVKEALVGTNKQVNLIIVEYLRMQKSHKWSSLCAYVDALYIQLTKLQGGEIEGGEKTKDLLKNISDIEDRIDALTADLANKDKSPVIKDSIFQAIEDGRLGLTPEDVARELSEGNDPLRGYNPYL